MSMSVIPGRWRKEGKMFRFKVKLFSVMTEEALEAFFEADNIIAAALHAYTLSCGTGFDEGNYDLYIELGGNWIDTFTVMKAAGEMEDEDD